MSAAAGKKYKAYSLGMKQRLGIASALLRPRRLLVLDEPTNGLDPQGTREIRTLVRELAADGTTVFVSSHLLSEVEQICDYAAIMRTGRLVASGSLAQLRDATGARLVVDTPDTDAAVEVLRRLGLGDLRVEHTVVSGGADTVEPDVACAALVREDIRVRSLTTTRATLEEAFVALTGEGFDVAS